MKNFATTEALTLAHVHAIKDAQGRLYKDTLPLKQSGAFL